MSETETMRPPPMSACLTGCHPDPPDERDRKWSDRAGDVLTATTPWTLDARPICPPIDDQIASNCEAHAFADATWLTCLRAGKPIARPSVAYFYAIAREQATPGEVLVDNGCTSRNLLKAARSLGCVASELWPETPETTNAVPPVDVLEHGEAYTITAYHRIDAGSGLTDGIISALQRNLFPVIAMPVDEAFRDAGTGVYTAPGGKVIGNHAMVVVGWDSQEDALIIRNSWGTALGADGYWLMSRALANELVFDCWAIEVGPKGD